MNIKDFRTLKPILPWLDYHVFSMPLPEAHVLEFGVFKGRTVNILAQLLPEKIIHGFDSWVGLPCDWVKSPQVTRPKKAFVTSKPKVQSNVKLYDGWIADTLPRWLAGNDGPVGLVHIDTDVYSSAKEILTMLNDRIIKGTIIIFDELSPFWENHDGLGHPPHMVKKQQPQYDYWEDHEWKALNEWADECGREVKAFARDNFERGSVIVE